MLDYTTTEKIRRLNDCFRRSMAFGGSVMLTTGVACLDSQRKVELLDLVRAKNIKPIPVTPMPLAKANQALMDLKAGKLVGRAVLTP